MNKAVPKLKLTAHVIIIERASNLFIIGEVKIVKMALTMNVVPLRIAICLAEASSSYYIIMRAGENAP